MSINPERYYPHPLTLTLPCPDCSGSGGHSYEVSMSPAGRITYADEPCLTCAATGEIGAVAIVDCPACQGEGRDIRYGLVYEPGCGHPHMGEVDGGICEVCGGTGAVEEPAEEPVTLDDLYDRCPLQGEIA